MKIVRPQKSMVDQVNEILAQNKRILAMNELLLRVIVNPPFVYDDKRIDIEELIRNGPMMSKHA